jgi:PAS domain S-box-containing protein
VESRGLGFQNKLKDEVVVTDAKLEIVFASHNMTKMNGYVEEEVIGRSPKCFKVSLLVY